MRVWKIISHDDITAVPDEMAIARLSYDCHFLASNSDKKNLQIASFNQDNFKYKVKAIGYYHSLPIFDIKWSPIPGYLATASADCTIIIWRIEILKNVDGDDLINLHIVRRLCGHHKPINTINFSKNGTMLVSAGQDATVILWNVLNGKAMRKYRQYVKPVTSAVFDPHGQFIVSTSTDGYYRITFLNGPKSNRMSYIVARYRLMFVQISPNGRYLLFSDHAGRLVLVDYENEKQVRQFVRAKEETVIPGEFAFAAPNYVVHGNGNSTGITIVHCNTGDTVEKIQTDSPVLTIDINNLHKVGVAGLQDEQLVFFRIP